MFNEFLTTTLQVIIALNVAGLIAYFCLGSRRRPTPTPASQPITTAHAIPSLWNKLIQPARNAVGRTRPLVAATAAGAPRVGETLDVALGRLRRILDGYGNSLQ